MAADHDFIRFQGRTFRWRGAWPPPERLHVSEPLFGVAVVFHSEAMEHTTELVRVSCSSITDEQIATMDHVLRGAEYEVA